MAVIGIKAQSAKAKEKLAGTKIAQKAQNMSGKIIERAQKINEFIDSIDPYEVIESTTSNAGYAKIHDECKKERGWSPNELSYGISETLLVELGHQIVRYCYDILDYDKAAFGFMLLGAGINDNSGLIEIVDRHVDYSFEWVSAHIDRIKFIDGHYSHKLVKSIGESIIYLAENNTTYPANYKKLEYKIDSDDDDSRSEEILALWRQDCHKHGKVLSKSLMRDDKAVSKSILWLGRYYDYLYLDN